MSKSNFLKIGEDELFLALSDMAISQNVNSWSDEIATQMNEIEKHFDSLSKDEQVYLSNSCYDLMAWVSNDGFKQGFKAAVALLRTLNTM